MRLNLTLLLCLVLAGCVSQRPMPAESWRLLGKLSLRTSDASHVLGIDWHHSAGNNQIALSGPLGVNVAKITAKDGEVLIDTGKSATRYRNDDLITAAGYEGLSLPWQSLASWIRGEVDAGGAKIGAAGASSGNWLFEVKKQGADGPELVTLEHPAVSLKLKVRSWQLGSSETLENDI